MLSMQIIYGNGLPVKLIDDNEIVYDVIPHRENDTEEKDNSNAKV